jgi:membrane fusion protein (multidrug efflux system)
MPELLTVTGTLRASQESEVAADASGKVTATLVERGQAVKQGQVLIVLDARSAALSANVASANSELAKAQLEQAQKECGRVDALFKSGAISQAEYDRTKSQCQTTEWSARAAQAQQQTVQKMVGDAIIKAPFSGVVGERFVNVGQYVSPSTKVVSLYTPDPLRLELTVPEQNVGALKQDMPVSFTVASYPDRTFTGTVKFISPNVRPTTRDLVIEALCPNADNALRPGMFAVGRLAVGEKKLPAIPKAAVVGDPTAPHVYVVSDKRVQERVVQVGGERDDQVAIIAGVKPGESVVLSPGPDVKDGATVAGE